MSKRSWTDKELIEALKVSKSIAGVLRTFGLKPAGGNYMTIKMRIKELNIDISHFTGQSHLRGKRHNWAKRIPLKEILVENSIYTNNTRLRDRLIKERLLERKCSKCGNTHWFGVPIPLELHHVNGDKRDNRIDNLRLRCPNCHALTPTYCRQKQSLKREVA